MKTYQEMAGAVFREGDRRLAARKKRRRTVLSCGGAGLALAACLAVTFLLRRTPDAVSQTLPPETEPTTAAAGTARETTARTGEAVTTTKPSQPGATEESPAAESRQPTDRRPPETEEPAQTEPPSGGGQNAPRSETTTAVPVTTALSEEEPSGSSGAASYSSEDFTEAAVDQHGWARFFRWPGYEDKFWVYYDGRTYQCDPFAGRPLACGDYLCALSDCAHDFADEDGAGVYVMLEDGEPVPVTAAVVIVFPDGASYAMIRPDMD